jgi:hypothetical protein
VFRAGNADQAIRIMEKHSTLRAVLSDLSFPVRRTASLCSKKSPAVGLADASF